MDFNKSRPLFQNISSFMLMLFSTLAQAEGLQLDAAANTGGTSIEATRNGIPLVNIAKPTARGVSHNRFTDYNVSQQGLILNNATQITNTQLGGQIQGNANLGTAPASLILNEVTSTNRSQLNGYTEVGGHSANLVVANPNGISCDGCGFINTPQATLTTGMPEFSEGALSGYQVNGGDIAIEGQGLNADNIDRLSIITRAVQINANIHAQQLDVITGRNHVNAQTGEVTALADDGSAKPTVAIDSSALGGMYANRIRLLGTEQGVGVNLNGVVSAGTEGFQLTADGRIVTTDVQSQQDVGIESKNDSVILSGKTYAQQDAVIKAGDSVTVEASGDLVAGRNITVDANRIENNNIISAAQNVSLTAKTDVINHGIINADNDLTVTTDNLLNNATLFSGNDMALYVRNLLHNNTGAYLFSNNNLTIAADTDGGKTTHVLNSLGNIEAFGDISISAVLLENIGLTNISYELYYRSLLTGETNIDYEAWKASVVENFEFKHRTSAHRKAREDFRNWLRRRGRYEMFLVNGGDVSNSGSRRWLEIVSELNDTSTTDYSYIIGHNNITLNVDDTLNHDAVIDAQATLSINGNSFRNSVTQQDIQTENAYYTLSWRDDSSGSSRGIVDGRARYAVETSTKTAHGNTVLHGGTIEGTLGSLINDVYTSRGGSTGLQPAPLTLPTSDFGLFVTNTNPEHPYLVETNPEFTVYENFISSDYMISRLGFDGSEVLKRLGDAMFENNLIREEILNQTGSRYLSGLSSDYEQFKYLMDNALQAQGDLMLEYGVSLTEDQINSLTQSIVWLEEKDVQGYRVIVPVVYIAQLGEDNEGHGGQIVADDIQLATLDESLQNYGSISATNDIDIVSLAGIDNISGQIVSAEGDVILIAQEDIINTDARISGRNIQISSEQGSFVSETSAEEVTINYEFGTETITRIGEQSNIQAADNLTINTQDDIRFTGAVTSAGGDIDIVSASGDIAVETVVNANDYNFSVGGGGHSRGGSVQNIQSSFKANDINMQAQSGNLTLEGAAVTADNNVTLSAAQELQVLAVKDREYSDVKLVTDGDMGTGSVSSDVSDKETVVGSTITAVNNVMLNADVANGELVLRQSGDVTITGSQMSSGNDTLIYSQGDVAINAESYNDFEDHYKQKTGVYGLKNTESGDQTISQNLQGSEIVSGGGTAIISGSNITVEASDMAAGGDIDLVANDNVVITAGSEASHSEQWTRESGYLSGGNLYEEEFNLNGEMNQTLHSSNVDAQGSVSIQAGSATVVSSNIAAGENISAQTDIGSIEILAGEEQTQTWSEHEKLTIGLGDAAKNLVNPLAAMETKDGKLTIKVADAAYDKVDEVTTLVTHKSSNLASAGDISLDSIEDIKIEGSNLAADTDYDATGSINLNAAESVIIKEAEDSVTVDKKETHGTAEVKIVVQHEAVETVKAVQALDDAKDQLQQANRDYRKYEKDLDNLKTQLSSLEQDYDNKVAGVRYEDVLELRELVSDVEDDKDWYIASIATATANVASKTTQLLQQTATAAQSASTYGFNAGIQFDAELTKTDSHSDQTSSLASSLSGQNIQIKTGLTENDQALIQGSQLMATDTISIESNTVNIVASKDTYQTSTDTESGSLTISQTVHGAKSGPSVNASLSKSTSESRGTTYNNSQLLADNIQIISVDDTNVAGANVHANESLALNVGGDLNVESLQNRSTSSSKSAGVSGGISNNADGDVSGANAGLNAGNSRAQTKETVLTSLTSGGSADINVNDHTQITGALVATLDAEGNELAQLNLSTNSLDYYDLTDRSYSSDMSASVSTNVSISGEQPANNSNTQAQEADGDRLNVNTSNITYSNTSSVSQGKTLATLGQGNVNITDTSNEDQLALLNRDVTQTNKDLYNVDRQQGNIDLTVDHRLLSEDGRKQIAEDYQRTEILGGAIADIATKESVAIQDTFEHIDNTQKSLDVQKMLAQQNDGEHAKTLNNLENATPEQKQAAINAYAEAYAEIYDITIDEAKVVTVKQFSGAHYSANGESSSIYINDNAQNNALDYADTLGHEITHAQISQGTIRDRDNHVLNDQYASIMGDYASDNYEFSYSNNDLGTVNTGNTNAHVGNADSEVLRENAASLKQKDPSKMDFRQFIKEEASMMDQARVQIGTLDISNEAKSLLSGLLEASACAKVRCADHVPPEDPKYNTLKQLQDYGDTLEESYLSGLMDALGVDTTYTEIVHGHGNFSFDHEVTRQGFDYGLGQATTDAIQAKIGDEVEAVGETIHGGYEFVVFAGAETINQVLQTENSQGFSEYMAEQVNKTWQDAEVSKAGTTTENSSSAATWQPGQNILAEIALIGVELVPVGKAGKAVGGVVETTADLLKTNKKVDVETQPLRGKYANRTDVNQRSADDVNSEFDGYNPPYKPGTRVTEYTTASDDVFVRVHGEGNSARSWMMRKEAIDGLSPEEIAKKYSLPDVPTHVSNVNVPAGSRIRTGRVAENFGGNEGAIQYQWLGRVPEGAISNTRSLVAK